MSHIHNFERKEIIWFGNEQSSGHIDIILSGAGCEFCLDGNILTISPEGLKQICLNKDPLSTETLEIEAGDVISLPHFNITVFEKIIQIESEEAECSSSLPEVKGQGEYFDDFPHYKRSPRIIYNVKAEDIKIQSPPAKKEISKKGLLQLILPTLAMMAFTIAMGVVLKRGAYMYMAVGMTGMTMIFSVVNFFSERKKNKAENAKAEEVYKDYLMRVRKRIRTLRAEEREALDYRNPDIKKLYRMTTEYSSRIYERGPLDDDFLTVNLGYCEGTSKINVSFDSKEIEMSSDELSELAKEIPEEFRKIKRVPVTVDLKRAHLGIVGSKKNVHEELKDILAQITFFQSYHDLQIIFIHGEDYDEKFSYARWYPHLRIKAINVIGEISGEQARDQILGSIQQILKDRKLKIEEEKQDTVFLPHLLFIIDEPKLILNHAIMEYLQKDEHNLGFSVIYTTDQKANLPENIKSICILDNAEEGRLLLNEGHRVNTSFNTESLGGVNLEDMARSLSAIIHEQGVSSKIPESITFFELYNIKHPEELNIAARWEKNQSHKSLAVPLGVRAKDDIVELNLHEKAHGPHGLVAGTTGSGKSEIVQSYILSLALNFHPHEVGFLLIDYKGGGMAGLFEKLPHLLGTITNLEKAESTRAMTSIKSELARRQRIFSENNVNHINGYNKLFKLGKVEEPLPHLFLISDEFAELKKEQPEFMSELVSAARIGRSLGIHLILATQKPSGVVDDQIWTNSKFKLCLKVQDAADSKEMIKTPDAANITQAGRAYLQVGNNEIYELFQSAWSGATYSSEETTEQEDDRVYRLNRLGQGEAINKDLSGGDESNQIKATQLDVVVEHIREVYEQKPQITVKKPWLPSLARKMVSPYTAEVKDSASFVEGDFTLGLGMVDIPEQQLQQEYTLDLVKNGHILYIASSGYGKSVFLTNIVMGLSMKNSVRNFNAYIVDLGNSALIPLKNLPHVADYMTLDDGEKFRKFMGIITEEIKDRKQKFAQAMVQNFFVYNQGADEKLKAILIVIDNYDVVKELGDEAEDFFKKTIREGAGLGIFFAVTATRSSALRSAVMASFKEKITGFNFDESENRAVLGRCEYSLPDSIKGRALVKTDQVNVMQVYSPVDFESDLEYAENLKTRVLQIKEVSTEQAAPSIKTLPETLFAEEISEYPGYIKDITKVPVGIDTAKLNVQYLDFSEGPRLIIGGSGTGRTNTMKSIMNHMELFGEKEPKIYLFDGAEGSLIQYSMREDTVYGNTAEEFETMLDELQEAAAERKEAFRNAKQAEPTLQIKTFAKSLRPYIILCDTVQETYETLKAEGKEMKMDVLADCLEAGMYAAATSDIKIRGRESKFTQALSEAKSGLILGDIREQTVFSYAGIRETNMQPDIGYVNMRGLNIKCKLIDNE